jgi:hypothetical protein
MYTVFYGIDLTDDNKAVWQSPLQLWLQYCSDLHHKQAQLCLEGTALVASQVIMKQEIRIHFYFMSICYHSRYLNKQNLKQNA